MSFWICATCAVEHAERVDVCAICADERQWVPADGQKWTTLTEMTDAGYRTELVEVEPDLWAVSSRPGAGIGQQSKLVRTDSGSLLFDPIGFLDDAAVDGIRELGPVVAIAASHPHMYGVQVEWSRRLGGVPVLVAEQDRMWVARPDEAIRTWSGELEVLPGVTLTQPGGHFPGSAVVHWAAGAEGKGRHSCRATRSSPTSTARPSASCGATPIAFRSRVPWSNGSPRTWSGSSSTGCTATSTTSSRRTPARSCAGRRTGTSAGSEGTSIT